MTGQETSIHIQTNKYRIKQGGLLLTFRSAIRCFSTILTVNIRLTRVTDPQVIVRTWCLRYSRAAGRDLCEKTSRKERSFFQ